MNNEIENKIELAVSTAKKVQVEANTMIGNERMSRLGLEKHSETMKKRSSILYDTLIMNFICWKKLIAD